MRWTSVCLLLALTACPKQAPEAPEQSSAEAEDLSRPLPVDPDVRMGVLENGLTYYIETNAKPEKRVTFRLALNAGAIQEDDDQQGLAHVVEHMAFNGSENFEGNDLITYLESVGTRFGAHLNAHTNTDETVYKLEVPTDDPEVLDTAFLVFDDWADGITFDPEEIEKERGVVLEEWRRRRGAGTRMGDIRRPMMYAGSPYAERNVIGSEESLTGFTHEALTRFYNDWYRPDLMAMIVVGDIDPDYAEAKIKEHFSDIAMPDTPRERVMHTVPGWEGTKVSILTDPEMTRTSVGLMHHFVDPEQSTYGSYRESIAWGLIYRMINERFGDLSQQPDAPFLGSSTGRGKVNPMTGYLSLGVSPAEGEHMSAFEAAYTELLRAERHGFSDSELQRAKDGYLRGMQDYYDERETTNSANHANEIVRVYLTGESMPGIEVEWELAQRFANELTLDELNAMAQELMPQDTRFVTVTLPEKEGLTPPTEEEVLALIAKVEASDIAAPAAEEALPPLMATLPEPGSITDRREVPELGATVWTLSSGVEVWFRPTDFVADTFQISGFGPGGYANLADEDYIAVRTMGGIRNRSGMGELTSREMGKVLAGKQAWANASVGNHWETASAGGSIANLEEIFQVLHLSMTAPRFDEDAFTLEKEARIEGVRNRDANPNTAFNDAWNEMVWDNHPRYQPWTLERIEEMDLEKSRSIFADRFADTSDFVWVISGTASAEDVEPLVERYIASLPALEREDTQGDDGARRALGVNTRTVNAGLEPQARFSMEIHTPFEGSWEQRGEHYAMRQILSVRMREELRENLGGVYSVGVGGGAWTLPEPMQNLTLNFTCDPERVDELHKAALAVFEKAIEEGFTEDELKTVQAKNMRSWETSLREDAFWRNGIRGALMRGENPVDMMDGPARSDALTVEALNAAAKTYIDLDNRNTLILMPAEGVGDEAEGDAG